MSKHVNKIVAALLSFSTHAAFATEAKRECEKMLVEGQYTEDDILRIDYALVCALAEHYECEYWPAVKNGKLSGYTVTAGGPQMALSRARALLLGVNKEKDTRSAAQKMADSLIKRMQSEKIDEKREAMNMAKMIWSNYLKITENAKK